MTKGLSVVAGMMIMLLAIYGYGHSMTVSGFPIQGWLGTLIPPFIGVWLYACGWLIGQEGK